MPFKTLPHMLARMTREHRFLVAAPLALCAALLTSGTLHAGFGTHGLQPLPADAYSLAQPEMLATPRELMESDSPLKLRPAQSGRSAALTSSDQAAPAPLHHAELFFLRPRLTINTSGQPLAAALTPRFQPLPEPILTSTPEAAIAATTSDGEWVEPVWFDPELEETVLRGENAPPALAQLRTTASTATWAASMPKRSLSQSILALDKNAVPEFFFSLSTSRAWGADMLELEDTQPLPAGESAASDAGDALFSR